MCYEKSESKSVGLIDLIETVKLNTEYECFSASERSLAESICRIIAEIYTLNDLSRISINGEKKTAEEVKEVYQLLTHENLEDVISNFKKTTYQVKNIKSYIRTALYNSVLEYELRAENDFRAKNGGT